MWLSFRLQGCTGWGFSLKLGRGKRWEGRGLRCGKWRGMGAGGGRGGKRGPADVETTAGMGDSAGGWEGWTGRGFREGRVWTARSRSTSRRAGRTLARSQSRQHARAARESAGGHGYFPHRDFRGVRWCERDLSTGMRGLHWRTAIPVGPSTGCRSMNSRPSRPPSRDLQRNRACWASDSAPINRWPSAGHLESGTAPAEERPRLMVSLQIHRYYFVQADRGRGGLDPPADLAPSRAGFGYKEPDGAGLGGLGQP